jgi:hypothetical protein
MRAKPAGTDRVSVIYATVSGNRARRTVKLEKQAEFQAGGIAVQPSQLKWIAGRAFRLRANLVGERQHNRCYWG